jgi:preprotein translocase subunit YajC
MGGAGFLIIIIAFAFLYFVLIRPQKRRQLEQQRMLNDLQVGDEVVTAGGIYGEITNIEDDEDVRVLIAPDLEVRVARKAIGGVINKQESEEAEEAEEAEEDDAFVPPEEPELTGPTPGT